MSGTKSVPFTYTVSFLWQSAAGKRVTFRCGAETDPRRNLSIEWLFNRKPLDLDGDPCLVVLTDNSLAITRTVPLDTGKYTCLAHTRLDNASADTNLIVQGSSCALLRA